MPQKHDAELDPQENEQIADLAARAEALVSRRAMIVSSGRKLVLPVLATFFVSREAMAAGGSGPIGKGKKGKGSWGSWGSWS